MITNNHVMQANNAILESLEIPALKQSLTMIPVRLAELRKLKVSLLKAKADAQTTVDMAERPIRTIAMMKGKNKEQRDSLAEECIAADPGCVRAQRALDALELEIANLNVDIQAQDDRFTAACHIADLTSNELRLMSR